MARLHDADTDACTCPTLAQRLVHAQDERDKAKRAHSGLRETNFVKRDWTGYISSRRSDS
ncbi:MULTISPECIES: hypothetical protein [unclassified Streptomyces]|uniref:hypothetical protein n=1 Tax=unclassified Streptomyces TaxID=2593676 RepID=UPI003D7139AD